MSKKNDKDDLEYIPDYEEQKEREFERTNAEDAAIEKRIKDSER